MQPLQYGRRLLFVKIGALVRKEQRRKPCCWRSMARVEFIVRIGVDVARQMLAPVCAIVRRIFNKIRARK